MHRTEMFNMAWKHPQNFLSYVAFLLAVVIKISINPLRYNLNINDINEENIGLRKWGPFLSVRTSLPKSVNYRNLILSS